MDRLSSIDASFLTNETSSAHMHVGAVLIFEGPPPAYDSPQLAAEMTELMPGAGPPLTRIPIVRCCVIVEPLVGLSLATTIAGSRPPDEWRARSGVRTGERLDGATS